MRVYQGSGEEVKTEEEEGESTGEIHSDPDVVRT